MISMNNNRQKGIDIEYFDPSMSFSKLDQSIIQILIISINSGIAISNL